ncbi:SRPBCC family protein [Kitasatospora sp. NPDC087314]|uniref:aromatase/cyclase n=1 Tax=Kitasatospora sp. NPDC087314 TaxID=3364068 RepID=UPI00380A11A5
MAAQQTLRETEHRAEVAAPPEALYRLVAEVDEATRVFASTLHVEHLERSEDGTDELIRIWGNGGVKARSWTSRRRLDEGALRLRFGQERPREPIAEMSGEWLFDPLPGGGTLVRLTHAYRAIDDDPAALREIDDLVERTSAAQLAALGDAAEREAAHPGLRVQVQQSVAVAAPAAAVYRLLHDVADWPLLLPRLAEVRAVESPGSDGVRTVTARAKGPDGAERTEEWAQVCLPGRMIAFKRLSPDPCTSTHTGYWEVAPRAGGGTTLTGRHVFTLSPGEDGRTLDRATLRAAAGQENIGLLENVRARAEQRTQP